MIARQRQSSERQRTAESRNGVAKIGNGKSMKRIERFRIGKAWQSEARALSRRDTISNGIAKSSKGMAKSNNGMAKT